MTEELYKKYRPTSFKQMVGQEAALRPLVQLGRDGKLPHSILITGPSGCGKTSCARILRKNLGCRGIDFQEMNAAQVGGVDSVREITSRIECPPMLGKTRVWLLDEAHKISGPGGDALLKVLEDTPKHAYFFLCTTDPDKLKRTLQTRCHRVELKALLDSDIRRVLTNVLRQEDVILHEDVYDKIAECSEGSARQALVFLHAVIGLKDVDSQLDAISKGSSKAVGIDIARALIKGESWKSVSKLLIAAKDEEAEKVRWIVMGYAKAVLLKSGGGKAAYILECFRDNYFDTKHNGLVMSCWDVLNGDKK